MTITHPAAPDFVDPLDLVEPARFARNGYPPEVGPRLRAEAPVAYFEPEGFEPFWAITKHADIQSIASRPKQDSNEHGLFIAPVGDGQIPGASGGCPPRRAARGSSRRG